MRGLLTLLLLAALAGLVRAGDEASPAEVQQASEAVGGPRTWGELPLWRQKMIIERLRRFASLSPEEQVRIRQRGLRRYLLEPSRPAEVEELPPALREELPRLPADLREKAAKLLVMRWRQLQLDEALRRVPGVPERRMLFRRVFPEPFEAAAAQEGVRELRQRMKRAMVESLRPRLAELESQGGRVLTDEERKARAAQLLAEDLKREEARLVERVRKEMLHTRRREPGEMRRAVDRWGWILLDRLAIFATPRERELIRYAFEPQECPILDFGFMGPPPEDPGERRLWEEDYRAIARLDLLTETNLPTEMVLHLADTGSPEDLLRALKSIRGERRAGG